MAVGIERKGRGIARMYAQVISNGGSKALRTFFSQYIANSSAIRTDQWRGYGPLKKEYANLFQEKSGYCGKNFVLLHRCIMMLKNFIRGTHHSVKRLQSYLDQYAYRFNHRFWGGKLFDNLVETLVRCKPVTHDELKYCVNA